MKVTNLVALLAALLLTVAEFLVFEYDARQNVVLYQAEAASALAARGLVRFREVKLRQQARRNSCIRTVLFRNSRIRL